VGKNTIVWLATIVITLSSVYYQCITNPNLPLFIRVTMDGQPVELSFPQSSNTGKDAFISIPLGGRIVSGDLQYRRFYSNDNWTRVPMEIKNGALIGRIPQQPAAGKVLYRVSLIQADGSRQPLTTNPIIMRFKRSIPGYILLPHILLMFASLLFSTRTGLEAAVEGPKLRLMAWWTLGLLCGGGLILGPIAREFALDTYWTGWPFGQDMTDNKTLLAASGWVFALWKNRIPTDKNRKWYWIAAIIHLAVTVIPHGALGSDPDYNFLPPS